MSELLTSGTVPIGGLVRTFTVGKLRIENGDGSIFIPYSNNLTIPNPPSGSVERYSLPTLAEFPNMRSVVTKASVLDPTKTISYTGDTLTGNCLMRLGGEFHVVDDTFTVRSYLPNGTKTQTIDLSPNTTGVPQDGTVGGDGNFYVMNTAGEVFIFDPNWAFISSKLLTYFGGLSTPRQGFEWLPQSNVFLSKIQTGSGAPWQYFDTNLDLVRSNQSPAATDAGLFKCAEANGIIYVTVFAGASVLQSFTENAMIIANVSDGVSGKSSTAGFVVDIETDPANPTVYMINRSTEEIFAITPTLITSSAPIMPLTDLGSNNPNYYIRVA